MQRLLVGEDDPEVQSHVQKTLEAAGDRVLTAANGDEGLCLFRAQPVDLALVELHIPGMDGLDLVRMLHRTRFMAKIITVGASGMGTSCGVSERPCDSSATI